MKLRLAEKMFACFALAALPCAATAATVTVNGLPDVPGVSYQKLSSAVQYVQSTGKVEGSPHVINITTDTLNQIADGEVVVTQPLTIEGDADGNGVKADILVDSAAIQALATSAGRAEKCYLEVDASSGTVTINNLKIHPNADGPSGTGATPAANSVDAIRCYRPALGEFGSYVFNNVWISGSDSSNNFIPLDTASNLYSTAGVKRWSYGPPTAANTPNNAVIQLTRSGTGHYSAELNNCMAGLGLSNALNIPAQNGDITTVTGGLYGHVARDGIRISGTGVTLTGSPTNRLRVIRSTSVSAGDAHGVEIDGGTVVKMEYVDVATANTGQMFKFANSSTVNLMQYCRALGKYDVGANDATLVNTTSTVNVRNCTFVGTAGGTRSENPFTSQPDFDGQISFVDCIFSSENSGVIRTDNTNAVGSWVFDHCAIPTDGFTSETLSMTAPIVNTSTGQAANIPAPTNSVSSSPRFIARKEAYDWSEAAVSIDGSNASAGNPDVLRPRNYAYRGAASDGSDLTGGAVGDIPLGTPAEDWQLYQ